MPDLQTHSLAMGQKDGKKWTAAADSQPTTSKSDRLLGACGTGRDHRHWHNQRLALTWPCPVTTMPIWKKPIDLALLKAANRNTAVEHLGIEFVEVGDDFLRARVPVDHRTIQPLSLIHI